MKENLFYYSAATFIAYKIAEKYYKDTHYVWCTPEFDSVNNPPSSNPRHILKILKEDIEKKDLHSFKVKENKAGLRKGAKAKLNSGIINQAQFTEILTLINRAEFDFFKPILFIIKADSVRANAKEVPLVRKANLFSTEILIEELPRDSFDIIEIP